VCAAQSRIAAISSGVAVTERGLAGGCALATRAMAASSSKRARSESRRRARSAKRSTASSTLSCSARKVSANFQKRLSRTSLEQVSRAANGFQVCGILRIRFYLFAETAHIDIYTARGDEAVGAPDGVEQLIAREHAVGARSEVIEQAKF